MRVEEIDPAVSGVLKDELERCESTLRALQKRAAEYPKGALNVRKKAVGKKSYSYHYLVFRMNGKVVNQHVSKPQLPPLRALMEERDRCLREIAIYQKRIKYITKLLQSKRKRKSSCASPK